MSISMVIVVSGAGNAASSSSTPAVANSEDLSEFVFKL